MTRITPPSRLYPTQKWRERRPPPPLPRAPCFVPLSFDLREQLAVNKYLARGISIPCARVEALAWPLTSGGGGGGALTRIYLSYCSTVQQSSQDVTINHTTLAFHVLGGCRCYLVGVRHDPSVCRLSERRVCKVRVYRMCAQFRKRWLVPWFSTLINDIA